MKFTTIRIDSNNNKHLKTIELEKFIERIQYDTKDGAIDRLRRFVELNAGGDRVVYWDLHKLARIYPLVELGREGDGSFRMKAFNNLVLLDVNGLTGADEAEQVKQRAGCLPSTLAAFVGSSGRSVKILVRVVSARGGRLRDADEAARFYRRAYKMAAAVYDGLLQHPVTRRDTGGSLLPIETAEGDAFSFRMPLDAQPYFNAKATPLVVPDMIGEPAQEEVLPDVFKTDGVGEEVGEFADEKEREQDVKLSGRVSRNTQRLIAFLQNRFEFRYNTVFGYPEYRPVNMLVDFKPVDERTRNTFSMNARLAGLDVWDKDVNRFLTSNMVRSYSPIHEYLMDVYGKWDHKDHIGELARTVPNGNPHWEDWFRTWFLGMVAQWLGRDRYYGNSVAPLLISRQGFNKSTFCKSLIPRKLQWGYMDNIVLSDKKAVMQAMSQMLLVNLDEFNSISPAIQQGFLKNVIQLANVKLKRPYGRHVEVFPRLASFIATTNVTDILADPSGCRRFIGVELTGPIRLNRQLNHEQLYAQAVAAIVDGERYWFDADETALIMESNRRFQMEQPIEQFFRELFDTDTDERHGEYLTTAAIVAHIRSKVGSLASNANLRSFGRWLSNLDGLQHKRGKSGTLYLVRRRG